MASIASAQIYAQIISNKLGFFAVEIIQNEVISAAKFNQDGAVCLLHCRVGVNGFLEFTVHSNKQDTADLLISTLYSRLSSN